MMGKYQFLCALDNAAKQAKLNRGRATPVCDAIQRVGLPIPYPKNPADVNTPAWEKEVAQDPIFKAVEAASRPLEDSPTVYRLMAYAEAVWVHYLNVESGKEKKLAG